MKTLIKAATLVAISAVSAQAEGIFTLDSNWYGEDLTQEATDAYSTQFDTASIMVANNAAGVANLESWQMGAGFFYNWDVYISAADYSALKSAVNGASSDAAAALAKVNEVRDAAGLSAINKAGLTAGDIENAVKDTFEAMVDMVEVAAQSGDAGGNNVVTTLQNARGSITTWSIGGHTYDFDVSVSESIEKLALAGAFEQSYDDGYKHGYTAGYKAGWDSVMSAAE